MRLAKKVMWDAVGWAGVVLVCAAVAIMLSTLHARAHDAAVSEFSPFEVGETAVFRTVCADGDAILALARADAAGEFTAEEFIIARDQLRDETCFTFDNQPSGYVVAPHGQPVYIARIDATIFVYHVSVLGINSFSFHGVPGLVLGISL